MLLLQGVCKCISAITAVMKRLLLLLLRLNKESLEFLSLLIFIGVNESAPLWTIEFWKKKKSGGHSEFKKVIETIKLWGEKTLTTCTKSHCI